MFWKIVSSKSWLRIRLQCSISICFKFLTAGWYVVTKDNLVRRGGTGGSESPASRTTFSHLPYFYALLSPDSHSSLCCSRLQVNQEDQKPRCNFQTVPNHVWSWRRHDRKCRTKRRTSTRVKPSEKWQSRLWERTGSYTPNSCVFIFSQMESQRLKRRRPYF